MEYRIMRSLPLFANLALNFICKKNSRYLSFTSIVSILGVAFGVAAFLVVITVLNSFQEEMKHIISSINPNLIVYSQSGIPDPKNLEKQIFKISGSEILNQSPFIYQESIMGQGRQTSAVYIRAITGSHSASATELSRFMSPKNALKSLDNESSLIDDFRNTPNNVNDKSQLPHVILGRELADNLNTSIGQIITLMTFDTGKDGTSVRYNKLYVTGVINIGISWYDKQYVLMNFTDGVKLFGAKNWASGIELRLKDPANAVRIGQDLNKKISYDTVAWQQLDSNLFSQIERDGTAIKLIVLIISIVAGFNIIVTLSLTVLDRSKQIALLRSLGARKILIIKVFVLCGSFLGILGATIGVGAGVGILKLFSGIHLGDLQKFYYLERIPVHINLALILAAFFVAVTSSLLGAFYPAWRASKVSPLIGLKNSN